MVLPSLYWRWGFGYGFLPCYGIILCTRWIFLKTLIQKKEQTTVHSILHLSGNVLSLSPPLRGILSYIVLYFLQVNRHILYIYTFCFTCLKYSIRYCTKSITLKWHCTFFKSTVRYCTQSLKLWWYCTFLKSTVTYSTCYIFVVLYLPRVQRQQIHHTEPLNLLMCAKLLKAGFFENLRNFFTFERKTGKINTFF